jgi:4-aminobutyrate aminotransferase-like enzyme/Ser/Thr protein kinase RdoA (MazF antagonist)
MTPSIDGKVGQAPRFSEAQAERLARELFGVDGDTRPLPSERDQNFRLDDESGARFVLKIANASEDRAVLELQNRAMEHLGERADADFPMPCPAVRPTRDGAPLAEVQGADGRRHFVRLLTWLPGKPLAKVRPHDAGLLRGLGRLFGWLDRALEGFDHSAAHREFHWDLRHAGRVVARYKQGLEGTADLGLVEGFLEAFEATVAPRLADLPRAVIHGDGNDYNVMVTAADPWQPRATGVIDFGDMVHSCTICDLAVTAAYAVLSRVEPLVPATQVVGGYHDVRPLGEQELALLHNLIGMRLCASVCIAAEQRRQAPANAYLGISETQAWNALRRWSAIHPRLAECAFREACGLDPCANRGAVVSWLGRNRADLGPVIDADLSDPAIPVLDLSVGSLELPGIDLDDTSAFNSAIAQRIRDAGASLAVGRYDEPRLCYSAEQFAEPTDDLPERRTVHLGIDLFLEPGAPVRAALDGRVHGCRDNAEPLDYGPTIILRHEPEPGVAFHTLYGHLDPSSLNDLAPGMPVRRGQRIGSIGSPPTNGGWPPHLHFQLIVDLFDAEGNFPGVASPRWRSVWKSVCPDPSVLLGLPGDRPDRGLTAEAIVAARRRHLGPSLSLHYREPLHIVRGRAQFLYDAEGRAYLDGVNNVCHVGHCHPRVVAAGSGQMAVLNTNTRYLHAGLVEYVRRLCATLPGALSVGFLVCSGSEANELALRMARAHTGRRDVVVLAGGYHGNTQALVDVSAYKYDGPGGTGRPAAVREAVMPDVFRGPYRGADAAVRYADEVRTAVEPSPERPSSAAAFLCEPLLGCGGQIVPPPGYLEAAFAHARRAGAVCIADEVQVGFGRVGRSFWAFEAQGAVPDIVTLGKPMGNGHPIGAVITTPEIAGSFAGGMEYFNTFGGNPVSCAVGLAVLDVLRDEDLQRHAERVGSLLLRGLARLMERHALIGDVRGMGLFLGVELVLDRDSREPAPVHAAHVVERMREHGILLSTDGPDANVIKLKPPMVFDAGDAERLVACLDRVLAEDCLEIPRRG